MTENTTKEKISFKWLIYTFIIGISLSACFYSLTEEALSLSIFPFLTLYFSMSKFYKLYNEEEDQSEVVITPAWASFLIGVFSYAALTGALHPELGSNLLSVIITLVIAVWFIYKLVFGDKKSQT